MNIARGNNSEFLALQRCRLFIEVDTLADVLSADRKMIKEVVYNGIPLRSTLRWPIQGNPTEHNWVI